MTTVQKIWLILFLLAMSVACVIGNYWGVEFMRRSVDMAGTECIRHVVGGFLLSLGSTAALCMFGVAGFMTIWEDYL